MMCQKKTSTYFKYVAEASRLKLDRLTADRGLAVRILLLLLFCSSLFISSCNSDATLSKRPENLLNQSEMVSFLIDLHLAEAKMSYVKAGRSDSLEMLFRNYEAYLMDQHGFTDSVYLRSYEYYLDHMELLDDIYSDVVDSLSVMNSQQKAQEIEPSTSTSEQPEGKNQK